jgi:hypothetical protein
MKEPAVLLVSFVVEMATPFVELPLSLFGGAALFSAGCAGTDTVL